jgi:hypothetical protein
MSFVSNCFINIVKKDNLIGLKELWKSSSDKIDIHYDDELTFQLLCRYEYLEVAK